MIWRWGPRRVKGNMHWLICEVQVKLSIVVYTYKPSTQEAEAGGLL